MADALREMFDELLQQGVVVTQTQEAAEVAQRAYAEAGSAYRALQDQFKQAWYQALFQRAKDQDIACCSGCRKRTTRSDSIAVKIEQCRRVSCGYGGGSYGYEKSQDYKRFCGPTCLMPELKLVHVGQYDTFAGGQTYYKVVQLVRQLDGTYCIEGGVSVDFEEPSFPFDIEHELSQEWGFPPHP